MTGPLLLLDVDGVLNPYRAKPSKRPAGYTTHRLTPDGRTYRVWLNPSHGRMLLDFAEKTGAELVWATTWEHAANRLIAPLIGLPTLPVIGWGYTGVHWKFDAVQVYAQGRPLAWLDDDFGYYHREREWFEERRGDTPTLLHHVDPAIGLLQGDLDAVGSWLASGVTA